MLQIRKRDLTFYKMTAALAFPIALQNLISVSLSFIDTFMVGMLGEAQMAAVTLANVPVFVLQLFAFGFQSGSSVLISQFWGKKDTDAINRVLGLALSTAVFVGAVFALILFFFPEPVMGLLTNNVMLAEIAARYARIIGFSSFFNLMSSIYIGAHRSMENPRLGLYVFSLSMALNTFLNWVLIFGNLGAPALGVEGSALATLIARVLEFCVTVLYAINNKWFSLKVSCLLRPGRALFFSFIRYSAPVVANETLWGLGTSLYPVIMGHMEESAEILAAFTISSNVEQVFNVVGFSIAFASAVVVGKEIGAGGRKTVYHSGIALGLLSLFAGAALGIVMLAVTETLIVPLLYPFYRLSRQASAIATMMITVRGSMLPFTFLVTTGLVGILRGGGDVRAAAWIDLAPLWLAALPAAAITGLILKMPILWVFLCVFSDLPVKILLGVHRFRSRRWIHDVTRGGGGKAF